MALLLAVGQRLQPLRRFPLLLFRRRQAEGLLAHLIRIVRNIGELRLQSCLRSGRPQRPHHRILAQPAQGRGRGGSGYAERLHGRIPDPRFVDLTQRCDRPHVFRLTDIVDLIRGFDCDLFSVFFSLGFDLRQEAVWAQVGW